MWCDDESLEIDQLRAVLALLSSAAESDNFDAFGHSPQRTRATAAADGAVSVDSLFAGLRPLLHSAPHARLMAHSNERRRVRFDAATHDVLSVAVDHELHLPALPLHTAETAHNDSAALQHTVVTGAGSLTLVERRAAPADQLERFARCSAHTTAADAIAACVLGAAPLRTKRATTRIVARSLHEPLRVHVHDSGASSVEPPARRRQASANVTPANATHPAFVSNPRALTNCAKVEQCADKAFGFAAPREPKHRFERGIGNVNAFTVLRAVSDVKLPNISVGGDIVVFAGATVQV
jgi:hypothetical protein